MLATKCRQPWRGAVSRFVAPGLVALAWAPAVQAEFGCGQSAAAYASSLVEELAVLPEGSWLRVSENSISEVFTPREQRPASGALVSTPEKIIRAWSGFAWDCRRGDLVIFGGGHANYSGNDTYRWRSSTRRWERMSLPSDVVRFRDTTTYTAVDGAFAAPVGAHTYDNNIYLPFVDRFLVLGGSAWNTGRAFEAIVGPDEVRITGPYLFDLSRADPNRVGGTTGSHVHAPGFGDGIVGGMMWQNRDLYELFPGATLPMNFTGGTTAYARSEGRDVVYLSARASQYTTQQTLYRYEIEDADSAFGDVMTVIGVSGSGGSGRGAGTYDPRLNAFVRTSKSSPRYDIRDGTFVYWDLSSPGPGNRSVVFEPVDLSGGWVLDRGFGLDYDPVRHQYLLWGGDRDVWILKAPSVLSAVGWTIERASSPGSIAGPTYAYVGYALEPGGGVLGKWKYIPELDAFMGLEGPTDGNVWLYKPVGWVRPGSALPPVLSFRADPAEVAAGEASTLVWTAEGAQSCTASGAWFGVRSTAGTETVGQLIGTSDFALTCSGPGGETSRTVRIRVVPPISFAANPSQLPSGASTTLTWSAPWAEGCAASGGWSGPRAPEGSEASDAITADTEFDIECWSSTDRAARSILVSIATPPVITLTADPAYLSAGMTSTLRWSVKGAAVCEASRGWSGTRPTSGEETVGPINVSTRYDLTCTGPGGTSTSKMLIRRAW